MSSATAIARYPRVSRFPWRIMARSLLVSALFALLWMPPLRAGSTAASSTNIRRVEITARRFAFEPGDITLKKGEPVLLVLKSQDVAHGIRIGELGVELKAPKGGSTQIEFTPDKTGDFVGHCFVFCGSGHGTMTLKLHVVG